MSKITEGILGDIARRDLSGGKKIENLLRPENKLELMGIIWDEMNRQGKDLDLRHIVIPENNIRFNYLFVDGEEIESLDLTGWNVSNIETFYEMFSGCHNLKTIKGMENWDVSNAHNFIMMFNECRSLEEIDLSGWKLDFNPRNVNNETRYNSMHMDNMFFDCRKLKKIIGFENWNIPKYFSDTIAKGFCKYITDDGIIVR